MKRVLFYPVHCPHYDEEAAVGGGEGDTTPSRNLPFKPDVKFSLSQLWSVEAFSFIMCSDVENCVLSVLQPDFLCYV